MKKLLALVLALASLLSLTACGGSNSDSSADSGSSDGAVSITIFNSKNEIQPDLEAAAAAYSAANGVNIEVYYSQDTVAAHLATRYAAKDPYTINMVDAKDVYTLGVQYGYDMSGQDWVADTDYAITVDGKVLGFPVCIEARGIIYNGEAIRAIVPDFDPTAVKTTEEFQAVIDALIDGGMETPTGVMKEDWSLAAHFLAEVYEMHADPDAFIAGIKDGSIQLAEDDIYNAMMDTFDVLKDNNYAKASAISAEREVTEQMLAEGELAFMFGGNWDWSVINAYNYSDDMGMMPVPNDLGDGSSDKLVGGGSKYFYVDNGVSEEQQQAAKDFLNWLVYDEEGQSFLVEECALVPAYSNITLEVADPLGASVKAYTDADALIGNYNYLPDDHYAKVGASFQKYLAGQIDRVGLADEITAYWATAEVGAH